MVRPASPPRDGPPGSAGHGDGLSLCYDPMALLRDGRQGWWQASRSADEDPELLSAPAARLSSLDQFSADRPRKPAEAEDRACCCVAAQPWDGGAASPRGLILWAGLAFFAFATIAVLALESRWVIHSIGVLASGTLALAAWLSLLIGKPFTLDYAGTIPTCPLADAGLSSLQSVHHRSLGNGIHAECGSCLRQGDSVPACARAVRDPQLHPAGCHGPVHELVRQPPPPTTRRCISGGMSSAIRQEVRR